MPGCLHLTAEGPRADRPPPFDEDVSFSEAFVETILERYTRPGDIVIDPFAGFGTTIAVAERMDRIGYGVELLPERADYIRARVAHPDRVLTADARSIAELGLPPAQFSLSSPPYMTRIHHPENPLTAYTTLDGDYATYLADLAAIYRRLAAAMTVDGRIAINVANIRAPFGTTLLAWDVGRIVADHLDLEEELPIHWDRQDPMISQDYCLVYRRAASRSPSSSD